MIESLLVELLTWALIIAIKVRAFGTDNLGAPNWGAVPAEFQKAQLDSSFVVPPNNTWIPFFFDNVGSWAFPQFQVTITNTTALTRIQWTDAFCAGDAFAAYFFSTSLNTSFNGRNPSGVASCGTYVLDPTVAFSQAAFSAGSFNSASPTTYNVTLVARVSPFSAGRGYARVLYP